MTSHHLLDGIGQSKRAMVHPLFTLMVLSFFLGSLGAALTAGILLGVHLEKVFRFGKSQLPNLVAGLLGVELLCLFWVVLAVLVARQ